MVAICSIAFGITGYSYRAQSEAVAHMKVSFLDVGQGDATFIESPRGVQVLIDGGPDTRVLRELGAEMGFFDRTIDMLIATHPDQDHIGGLIHVLDRYEVGRILITDNQSDTPVAQLFLEKVKAEGAEILYARAGQRFAFDGVELKILFPDRDVRALESNTSSIIAELVYGEIDFIFTGDSPQSIERYMIEKYGDRIQSDVLKVGHHGSKTSSDETFIEMVGPDLAVISSGKDNRYGHPHAEVIATIEKRNSLIKNTADSGTVTIVSDGIDFFIK